MTNEKHLKYIEGKKFIYVGNGVLAEIIKSISSTLKDASEGVLVLGDKKYLIVGNGTSSTEFPDEKTLASLIQEMQVNMQENTQLTVQSNEAYLIKKVQEIEPLSGSYSREHLHEDNSRRPLNLESALKHQIRIFNNNKGKYLNVNRHPQKH